MRSLVFLAVVFGVGGLTAADAQTTHPISPSSGDYYLGYGGYGRYHASTVAEGRLRGMGDLVRSTGQANLYNSGAAINLSIARRNELYNWAAFTDTYFQVRQANRAYRAAERGPLPTMEDLIRYARVLKPRELSPGELDPISGAITWPILLRSKHLAEHRTEVETAFAKRAVQSVLGAEDYLRLRQVTEQMGGELRARISEVPSYQYMISKRFIESLAYAAGTPSINDAVGDKSPRARKAAAETLVSIDGS